MTIDRVARQLLELAQSGTDCTLVTVVRTEGSTPREVGAHMLVTAATTIGTIGGGTLEYRATAQARELLAGDGRRAGLEEFTLGPELGQCCGGVALVLFEVMAAAEPAGWIDEIARSDLSQPRAISTDFRESQASSSKTIQRGPGRLPVLEQDKTGIRFVEQVGPDPLNIVVFGVGHVGAALVNVLGGCGCTVKWVDSRADMFPPSVPENVTCVTVDDEYRDAVAIVDEAPPQSCFVVLTHSHALDFFLCETVLRFDSFRYLGLIGSKTKREKFKRRLREGGIVRGQVDRLICPIGVAGITGKIPGEIAVAVAAELLQLEAVSGSQPGSTPAETKAATATEGSTV